jgi:hypothetical protein
MLKEKESLYCLQPSCCFIYDLRRTPTIEEYKTAVKGINLTQFAPSNCSIIRFLCFQKPESLIQAFIFIPPRILYLVDKKVVIKK